MSKWTQYHNPELLWWHYEHTSTSSWACGLFFCLRLSEQFGITDPDGHLCDAWCISWQESCDVLIKIVSELKIPEEILSNKATPLFHKLLINQQTQCCDSCLPHWMKSLSFTAGLKAKSWSGHVKRRITSWMLSCFIKADHISIENLTDWLWILFCFVNSVKVCLTVTAPQLSILPRSWIH